MGSILCNLLPSVNKSLRPDNTVSYTPPRNLQRATLSLSLIEIEKLVANWRRQPLSGSTATSPLNENRNREMSRKERGNAAPRLRGDTSARPEARGQIYIRGKKRKAQSNAMLRFGFSLSNFMPPHHFPQNRNELRKISLYLYLNYPLAHLHTTVHYRMHLNSSLKNEL
jgi:hypothetical protein